MKVYTVLSLFIFLGLAFADDDDSTSVGTAVGTVEERQFWWNNLANSEKTKLSNLFDMGWFQNEIDEQTRIAYAHMAKGVYDFLASGKDSNPNDSYISFAPLLLRTSFHGSGSYTHAAGTGGSNGGTIFNHAELADKENGCISGGTDELFELFHGHSMVPLADSVVIAGVVALDVMQFPRMDLVAMIGGRDTIESVAHRDRLSGPDDDPMDHFTERYNLTPIQAVALVGGAHNFGSAHAKCSGYQGQWTNSPLSWFGPGDSDPTFFPDLLREDWRWYKVCTYQNDTVTYASIDDPFANGAIPEDSSSDEEGGEEDSSDEDSGDKDNNDEDSNEDSDKDSDEGSSDEDSNEDSDKDSDKDSGEDSDEDSNEGSSDSSDSDDEEDEPKGCQVLKSQKPMECQSHAFRGCDFEDGNYGTDEFPCDFNLLQMRLKSDFMLKALAKNLAFAQEFVADPALLAEEFGKGFYTLTHNGLNRCGLSGHGSSKGHTCTQMIDDVLANTCVYDGIPPLVNNMTNVEKPMAAGSEKDDSKIVYVTLASLTLAFSAITMGLVMFVLKKVGTSSKGSVRTGSFEDDHA